MVFNQKPSYYLPKREYVSQLLKHDRRSVEIDFSKEPKTVIKSIHDENLRKRVENTRRVKFDLQSYSIEPIAIKGLLQSLEPRAPKRSGKAGWAVTEPQYYFYLLRILELF